jgi:hypothetical protein
MTWVGGHKLVSKIIHSSTTLLVGTSTFPTPPRSGQFDLQIIVPNAALRLTLQTRDVHHVVLKAILDAARSVAVLCTPASVPLTLTSTTIDSNAASLARGSYNCDIGERQVVVVLATDAGVKSVVRV